MKKVFLFLFFFAALASVSLGQNANDWFITVWKPDGTTINFNAAGNGYTLKCVQLDGSGNEIPATMQTFTGINGNYTITTGITAGQQYRIYAYGGTLNVVSFYNSNTLLKVEQWGTTVWSSFSGTFQSCKNLDVTATDIPNLSVCQSLNYMFQGCESLVNTNGSMTGWQTQNIKDMSYMFAREFFR